MDRGNGIFASFRVNSMRDGRPLDEPEAREPCIRELEPDCGVAQVAVAFGNDPRCRLAVMTRQLTHTLVIGAMLGAWAFAEQTSPEQRSRALEVKELAVPFKGITANGQVEPGLLRPTHEPEAPHGPPTTECNEGVGGTRFVPDGTGWPSG